MGVLTHCNAGGLATSDYGTALAVIYAAEEAGKTAISGRGSSSSIFWHCQPSDRKWLGMDVRVTADTNNLSAPVGINNAAPLPTEPEPTEDDAKKVAYREKRGRKH